jgi:peptidoglycan/LPS O-acetylase OafA/YrhL
MDAPGSALPADRARTNLNRSQGKRFAGLDAIRFVCAFTVVMSHAPSSLRFLSNAASPLVFAAKVARDLFNGPAAVIVFFVISGFCIHWPYRDGEHIGLDYFARRYIRICVPLGAVLVISPYFGVPATELMKTVLWSLYCELVYYTIYPLLTRIAARFGWERLTIVTFVAALLWVLVHPNPSGNYATDNVVTASLIGLPCWLMGCVVASRRLPAMPSTRSIWLWRAAIFFLSLVALELRFHSPLHHDLTLNFFGILVMYWVSRELSYHENTRPWSWLERAGAWSYSLYIFHGPASRLPRMLFPHWSEAADWLARTPLTLASCYVFYRLFESPSHRLARRVAEAVRPRLASSG